MRICLDLSPDGYPIPERADMGPWREISNPMDGTVLAFPVRSSWGDQLRRGRAERVTREIPALSESYANQLATALLNVPRGNDADSDLNLSGLPSEVRGAVLAIAKRVLSINSLLT